MCGRHRSAGFRRSVPPVMSLHSILTRENGPPLPTAAEAVGGLRTLGRSAGHSVTPTVRNSGLLVRYGVKPTTWSEVT